MKKIFYLFFILLLSSCSFIDSNKNADEKIEDNKSNSADEDLNPIRLNIMEHKFDKNDNDMIQYMLNGTITNISNKQWIGANLFKQGENEKIESPYVLVEFENKTFKLEICVLSSRWIDERWGIISFGSDTNYSTGLIFRNSKNLWAPNTNAKFKLAFCGELEPIHFTYNPKRVRLIIPISLEDPVGFKYSNDFAYDISDDFKSYQQELSNKKNNEEQISKDGDKLIILLGGGTKKQQQKDIDHKALNYWNL